MADDWYNAHLNSDYLRRANKKKCGGFGRF